MLINLTNHPSNEWSSKQKELALSLYGKIADIGFPKIPPNASFEDIQTIAYDYLALIKQELNKEAEGTNAVHIMGEFTFVYTIVDLLRGQGIECIASTTERNVIIKDGEKISQFNFIRFRKYF